MPNDATGDRRASGVEGARAPRAAPVGADIARRPATSAGDSKEERDVATRLARADERLLPCRDIEHDGAASGWRDLA